MVDMERRWEWELEERELDVDLELEEQQELGRELGGSRMSS